ncbi:enamelin [Syngnathus scovelli]|uniref:enamelin n=1 Tax=Syngnathus scovelli TaxID=161590 RepID=UPI00210F31AF|nr:enamelin [Syngnathus scovelli]
MERAVIMMCLFVACSTAPVQESENNKIAAHANEALRLMEMYRLYQQQGMVANPFLPASETPGVVEAPPQVDSAPVHTATATPPPPAVAAAQPVGDVSEEEEDASPASKAAAPVAPLNSEEAEEAEDTEEAEEAAEAPAANPAAPTDVPAVVDPAAEIAAVDVQAAVDAPSEATVAEVAAEAAAPPAAEPDSAVV